ncbi:MAG: hypothetical protein IJZ82_08320 [Lachnospiraceae bacterium]|nr:hypothetical protein [Lachnospiraceae bacterium]
MNRRTMPFILMLVAGVFTCVMTLINEYSIVDKLLILSIVMLVFYMLGRLMQKVLDSFDKQNEEKAKAEEEAREKALKEQEEQEALQKQQETGEGEKKVG